MSLDVVAEAERLRQGDRRRWFEEECGREPWFLAWQHVYNDDRMGWLSCYLVPAHDTLAQLESADYGRVPMEFAPIFVGSDSGYRYERTANDEGYEPLIHRRSFHGLHPDEVEVVEEFRLFHNVFRAADGSLARVSRDGTTDETVVRFDADGTVAFRLGPLRQYLAAKQCTLVACIDWREHGHVSLDAMGIEVGSKRFSGEAWTYALSFGDHGFPHSRLLGKKVIEPPPVEESGVWPHYEERAEEYPSFIIGVDDKGETIEYSCEPDALGTYFDRDPDPNIPHYLTPVHFRREVLERYFARPDRYRVEDGILWCGSLGTLQLDNDHPEHIVVYLGDLGRDLPEGERAHWRLHNIAPEGPPESETSFRRNRLAQFTDPSSSDLVLPRRLREVNEAWTGRYGWPLFKGLSPEDAHEARRLRIPLSDSDPAFDEQVRVLAKITIESIDPRIRQVAPPPPGGQRGGSILRLHDALVGLGAQESVVEERVTSLLGALHALNNGVRHGKGDDWRRAAAKFGLPGKTRPAAFRDLLEQMLQALDEIEGAVQGGDSSQGR